MDSEFLALSLVFIVLGVAGIVLFNGTVPPSGAPCNCIIPTPEPSAAQGTSSIFVVLGVIFFPMGLLKGGLPSFSKPLPQPGLGQPSAKVATPVQILSVNLFVLGIVLLLIGVDALLVPSYLIYKNQWYGLAGVLITLAGAISFVWGLRKPSPP